jgi:hypothetical protein
MELIHIVRTRHVQSINNVHRLNMGVKSKKLFRLLKSTRTARTRVKLLIAGCWQLEVGGANRDRTDDLLLAKQALSQLSYGPVPRRNRHWWVWQELHLRPHPYQGCALTN